MALVPAARIDPAGWHYACVLGAARQIRQITLEPIIDSLSGHRGTMPIDTWGDVTNDPITRDQDRAITIVAVCGSLQRVSSNRTLLEQAIALSTPSVIVRMFEGLRELPHFDPDLEAGAPPPSVLAWRDAIASSDAVLIASPEYGHSLPGVLKNGVDWVIGTGELERKIVAVTCSSAIRERGRLGLAALMTTLRAVRAEIVGGEPIVRGATEATELEALLDVVRQSVHQRRQQGSPH
jgi:chromate reductase, NAD(P)H dehydrogenase (quinone)